MTNTASRSVPRVLRALLATTLFLIALTAWTGRAAAADPALSIDPAQFDFGTMNVGGESTWQGDFFVTNESDETVTFSGSTLDPMDPYNFPILIDDCEYFGTLAPGESCGIRVAFDPQVEGDLTAKLTINSNAPGPAVYSELSGKALPRLLPKANLTPKTADFGTQGIGTTTVRTLTLSDDGEGDLDIGEVAIGGRDAASFAVQDNKCSGRVIATGMTCDVKVTFTPPSAGIKQATFTITTDDATNPTTATLTGTGAGIVPNPVGWAKVTLPGRLPRVDRGKLKVPVTCITEVLERCVGRINAWSSGEALKNGKGGEFRVASGKFSLKPGTRLVTLALEPRTIRSLKKQRRLKARFEATVNQASGAATRLVVRFIRAAKPGAANRP